MAKLRLLVPESTRNYIQNPSARYDTAGWTAFSSTLTRTIDQARFGIGALKIISNGSASQEGIYYRVNNLAGINDSITVSVYVRGSGKVRIRLQDNPGGSEWSSDSVPLSNRWKRIEVTGRCSGGNDIRLYVETYGNSPQSVTFYADGAQMERRPYSTTYCDGDQPGCRWNIIQHNSIATRDAYTRAGGRWITVGAEEREHENLYMTVIGGLGVAPIRNNIQSYAIKPGSFFQSTKVLDRVITFTFHVKKDYSNRHQKTLSELHELRQTLINIVKPDKGSGGDEFMVEYQDGDTPLYFWARYDGGLEGEWDVRNYFVNSFPLRLLAVSPFLTEDDQQIAVLDFQESFLLNGIAGRIDGQWSHMNYGLDNSVLGLGMGSKGELFVAGQFFRANNNIAAIDPLIPVGYISYFDGEKWNKLGVGANGYVYDVAIAPNGYVYVVGAFTSIGGVAANYVAYWNGSSWNAMGSGLNAAAYTVAIAPNGNVYVGGTFTTAGGSTASRIARWDGSWHTVGAYAGLNSTVYAIAISPDGSILYVGGSFTDQYTLSANAIIAIAKYTVSTNTFVQPTTTDLNNTVLEVIITASGVVYIGGVFTATSGGTTLNHVAKLSGGAWIAMGDGVDDYVWAMAETPEGNLIVGGNFETAGDVSTKGVAIWNNSNWLNLDIDLSPGLSGTSVRGVKVSSSGDIFIAGGGLSGTLYPSKFSGITTVENIGSSEVSPFIYILGQGHLKWIENQTTQKRIYFDLSILDGEEVFMDFGKGTIKSTVRGDLYFGVLPGSDFGAFSLMPGENRIAVFMTEDVNAMTRIGYIPTHWSVDATQIVADV